MPEGKLQVTTKGKVILNYTSVKGKSTSGQIPDGQLSADLQKLRENRATIQELDGLEVEFDLNGNTIQRVRRKGEQFVSPVVAPKNTQPTSKQKQPSQQARNQQQNNPLRTDYFHNPYNFVPALPRDGISGELGDRYPVGHHVLYADRYTGVIHVKMTAHTPLLVLDAANAEDCSKDHKSYPVRLDAQRKPYIPPTSIKGMLRAAYEAVTNSRLSVFTGHEQKLAYRMPTKSGLALVPARVENGKIVLMTGTSKISSSGPQGPLYAAWLPRYGPVRTSKHASRYADGSRPQHGGIVNQQGSVSTNALRYPDGSLPEHGDIVACWVELIQHWRWDSRRNDHVQDFQYWRVRAIERHKKANSTFRNQRPTYSPDPGRRPRQSYHQPLNQMKYVSTGYVCITNLNIDRKHDERVFFNVNNQQPLQFIITDQHRQDWKTLIDNYQKEHEEEIRQGRVCPPALQHSTWSRHIVGINNRKDKEKELSNGTLLYVELEVVNGQATKITGLYPVNISRKLYECSPQSLLPKSLWPAESYNQLSPADRVFGWVNQQGKGAYRGHVRIGPVTCVSPPEEAIENFGSPGLPLAILGQPKPQQARFYVAKDEYGKAQANGLSKEQAGYAPGKGLRGRKVFPHHHGLPQNIWNDPMNDRTQQNQDGHFQEYRRPKLDGNEQRDNQNRSIQGWVKIGTKFEFDIHVTNLSGVELGALLWLLTLPEGHFHRFGGGKPLGFGSVRLEMDRGKSYFYSGEEWRKIYSSFDDLPKPTAKVDELIQEFQDAVIQAYGQNGSFGEISFIKAWSRMATGHPDRLPTHYPRARQPGQSGKVPPHPEGLAYEWFVANERTGGNKGPHVSLPDLATDSGLPQL